MTIGDSIGNNIKKFRELKGWTKAQLSYASGVSVWTIGKIENGRLPRSDTLRYIAEALNIDEHMLRERGE